MKISGHPCSRTFFVIGAALLAGSSAFGQFEPDKLAPFRQIERYTEEIVLQSLGRDLRPQCEIIGGVSVLFAGSISEREKQELIAAVQEAQASGPEFSAQSRWTFTSRGSTGSQGNPAILGYSFVPDGTWIPWEGLGQGPSNLHAAMTAQFGSESAWKLRFQQSFDRWEHLTGCTYILEPDDGAAFGPPGVGASGAIGVRGDLRIAGMVMTSGGVLAYNYFPNGGDMVLHTGQNWTQLAGLNYRLLRNTVMHEHGHGLGLGHVWPDNGTKLMEPALNTNFDGPMDDDTRGGQFLYGDRHENNDTNATRRDFGLITTTTVIADLSLNRSTDPDWFRVEVPAGKALNVFVTPIGFTYTVGNSSSSSSWSTVSTNQILDLRLRAFAQDGTTLLGTANNNGLGGTESLPTLTPPMNNIVHVNVDTLTSLTNIQRYQMSMWLTALTESYAPTTYSLFRGILVSGDLASLVSSDDDRLVVRPGLVLSGAEAPVQVIVESTARTTTAASMTFRLEASGSAVNLSQRIELFDFNTNSYEEVDSRAATTSDSVVDVTISSNADRFIQSGTNAIRARISYRSTGPVIAFPWTARIDQTLWTITYQ